MPAHLQPTSLVDAAGTSVRGPRITKHLSQALGLNLFASMPVVADHQATD
jgi:hypothetical protein